MPLNRVLDYWLATARSKRLHAKRIELLARNIHAHFARDVQVMADAAFDGAIRFIQIGFESIEYHDADAESGRC